MGSARRTLRGGLAIGLVAAAAAPASAAGSTIQVNTTLDQFAVNDGKCALREAVHAANVDTAGPPTTGCAIGGGGLDVINVPPGTYVLNSGTGDDTGAGGDLDFTDPDPLDRVFVTGTGPGAAIIDQAAADRVAQAINGAKVTFDRMTITGGAHPTAGGGGVLIGGDASVTVINSLIAGNSAETGGGVRLNAGVLLLTNSTLSGNRATGGDGGGVLANFGAATHSSAATITANSASGNGGGSRATAPSV